MWFMRDKEVRLLEKVRTVSEIYIFLQQETENF